MSFFLELYCHR